MASPELATVSCGLATVERQGYSSKAYPLVSSKASYPLSSPSLAFPAVCLSFHLWAHPHSWCSPGRGLDMTLLREALRQLFIVSTLQLPPGISTAAGIKADIDAQEQAAVGGGKAPAVTAVRLTRKKRVKELKGVDEMQLGGGSGGGYPVHKEGRELIGRMDSTTPGVFLGSNHAGIKNAAGTLRPPTLCDADSDAGSDAQSEGDSEDESEDEPEDDESVDEPWPADDPDPCPDNLTFLAGSLPMPG